MSFQDVVGQAEIKQRLLTEVNEGRIAHALLFSGNEGTGKFPLAMAYARYLQCHDRTASDACGVCPSCVQMSKLVHPDVHFVFPIVKKAKKDCCDDYLPERRRFVLANPNFNLEEWSNEMAAENTQPLIPVKESDELIRKLSLKSVEGGFKVIILWLPEKLNEASANKLLKLLEEPPAQTVFILITEAVDSILATILSRTQRIHLRPIAEADIDVALQTKYGILPAESRRIAHAAGGNFIRALESIQLNADREIFFELFVRLMRLSYARKVKEMKQWSEEVAGMGRERQKNFLTYCQHLLRENFIYNLHAPELTFMTEDEEQFSTRFAPFINERNVQGIMHELTEAAVHIGQNVHAKMVFFDFALKMIVLLKHN
ncbi:MAG: DNA polymerase III subunit delta' [Prevotellaceae bacterium]|jgi:DNA polymerase-3 subunit delta'|nr:DNA polymerase III subunit delta' [Prevotellaceae bacterium]